MPSTVSATSLFRYTLSGSPSPLPPSWPLPFPTTATAVDASGAVASTSVAGDDNPVVFLTRVARPAFPRSVDSAMLMSVVGQVDVFCVLFFSEERNRCAWAYPEAVLCFSVCLFSVSARWFAWSPVSRPSYGAELSALPGTFYCTAGLMLTLAHILRYQACTAICIRGMSSSQSHLNKKQRNARY